MDGVSGGLLTEPSCLGVIGIGAETAMEFGRDIVFASAVTTAVAA